MENWLIAGLMTAVTEMVGPRYRSACMTAVFVLLSLGIVNMALIASAVRDDLKYQLAFFAPQLFNLLCLFTIMPESPRWLFVRERFDELNEQLRRIATINGKTIPKDFDSRNFDRLNEEGGKPPSCFALLLTRRIRLRTLVVHFEWFTVSLVYYALLLNVSTLPGNLYVNTCISGAVEIPAVVIGTLAAKSPLGRRLSSLTLLILSCLALLICIPLIIYDHEKATTAMSLLGKVWIIAFHSVLVVYTSELFPTQLRSVALGSAMMSSRIGGAVAPYIGENLIEVWQPLPSTLMGGLVTVAAGLVLLLPETQGRPISDTIDQIEDPEGALRKVSNNGRSASIEYRRGDHLTGHLNSAYDRADLSANGYGHPIVDVKGNVPRHKDTTVAIVDGDTSPPIMAEIFPTRFDTTSNDTDSRRDYNENEYDAICLDVDNTGLSEECTTHF